MHALLLIAALSAPASAGPAPSGPLAVDRDLARATRDGRLPHAWATRSPDGHWTLVVTPAGGWTSAELSVAGVQTIDLGAAPGGRPLRLDGDGARPGPLLVTLQAALPDGQGVTWRFSVDPESVPVAGPRSGPPAVGRRGLLRWLGWGR
jgi:hypothetical protein